MKGKIVRKQNDRFRVNRCFIFPEAPPFQCKRSPEHSLAERAGAV